MYIRSLKERDIQSVREILAQGEPFVASYNHYIYWMLGKYFPSTCLVAERDDQILGYIGALCAGEKQKIFVWQIAVKANIRGQEIGRKLLENIVVAAGNLGICQLEIAINDKNIPCKRMVEKLVRDFGGTITEKETYYNEGFNETVYCIHIKCASAWKESGGTNKSCLDY